mmetsp:Transcript_7798/g.22347  ORF Transcript_7798/g.22347 Transcript_7798/m.22347 type:complete len:235 (-) Transcript_7798:219-923(-)
MASITHMPTLQTSMSLEGLNWPTSFAIATASSGGMNTGVKQNLPPFRLIGCWDSRAPSKSISFHSTLAVSPPTMPSSSVVNLTMFIGFMSMWTKPQTCRPHVMHTRDQTRSSSCEASIGCFASRLAAISSPSDSDPSSCAIQRRPVLSSMPGPNSSSKEYCFTCAKHRRMSRRATSSLKIRRSPAPPRARCSSSTIASLLQDCCRSQPPAGACRPMKVPALSEIFSHILIVRLK